MVVIRGSLGRFVGVLNMLYIIGCWSSGFSLRFLKFVFFFRFVRFWFNSYKVEILFIMM